MAEVRNFQTISGSREPAHQQDIITLLSGLSAMAAAGQLRALTVGYIVVCPGSSDDIVSDAAGDHIDRVACSSVSFRNETESAEET